MKLAKMIPSKYPMGFLSLGFALPECDFLIKFAVDKANNSAHNNPIIS
jgi:hypothetical protein